MVAGHTLLIMEREESWDIAAMSKTRSYEVLISRKQSKDELH